MKNNVWDTVRYLPVFAEYMWDFFLCSFCSRYGSRELNVSICVFTTDWFPISVLGIDADLSMAEISKKPAGGNNTTCL